MLREPAVSGMFYPQNPDDLKNSIEEAFLSDFGVGNLPNLKCENFQGDYPFNIIVPHAGFQYSAPAATFSYLKIVEMGFPETFIILSPNHTGIGQEILARRIFGRFKRFCRLIFCCIFKNVANMPARVKCALLAWHTIEEIIEKNIDSGTNSINCCN